MSTSWKPEVIADSSGNWIGNSLRFATKAESDGNVLALYSRWTAVQQYRSVESDEAVNSTWTSEVGAMGVPLPRSPMPDLEVTPILSAEQFVADIVGDALALRARMNGMNDMKGGSTGC